MRHRSASVTATLSPHASRSKRPWVNDTARTVMAWFTFAPDANSASAAASSLLCGSAACRGDAPSLCGTHATAAITTPPAPSPRTHPDTPAHRPRLVHARAGRQQHSDEVQPLAQPNSQVQRCAAVARPGNVHARARCQQLMNNRSRAGPDGDMQRCVPVDRRTLRRRAHTPEDNNKNDIIQRLRR